MKFPDSHSTPTPIQSEPTNGTELLSAPWNLVSTSGGAVERYQGIPATVLQGKDTLRITYNLHGKTVLGGDASAIIFDQNGWKYISLSNYGQNGKDGLQTVDIPLSAFGLNLSQNVGTLHTRFWLSTAYTIDITSIIALNASSVTPTPTAAPTPTNTPTPTPTPTPAIVSGTTYRLINQCGGKALDVSEASQNNGGNVITWTWTGTTNQRWKIETTSAGYYKLTAEHSTKVLDVYGAGTSDGTNVIQWSWANVTNQEWSITHTGNGYYKLLARHSGKALDVSGASTSDGANVQQWVDNGTCAQRWKIETL